MSKPDSSHYSAQVIAAAERAIAAAISTTEISNHGIGEPDQNGKYKADKPVSNPQFNALEVATAILYLIGGPVKLLRAVPRNASSSYGWKHEVERWGQLVGLAPYVSNGAFIVAAEWLDVPSRRHPGSPNVSYALRATREHDDGLVATWQRHLASLNRAP